jgi:hypothetical protein
MIGSGKFGLPLHRATELIPGFGCRTRRLERRFIGYPIRAERSSAAPFEAWRRLQVVLSSNCECLHVRAPQNHRDWPPGNCVGNLQPVSHMAYFQETKARCRRYAWKSASLNLGCSARQVVSKFLRACSNVAAVPAASSPRCDKGWKPRLQVH